MKFLEEKFIQKKVSMDKNLENYKSRKDKLNFLNNVFESEDETDAFLG